jgi:sterol 24-C-methyltransferase
MCLNALKSVGFEIIEYRDLADVKDPLVSAAQEGWHIPLKGSYSLSFDSASRWKMTPVGRFITDTFVWMLETVGIAPSGSRKVSQVLNLGADSLVEAADLNLFTPMFYVLVRKPLDA